MSPCRRSRRRPDADATAEAIVGRTLGFRPELVSASTAPVVSPVVVCVSDQVTPPAFRFASDASPPTVSSAMIAPRSRSVAAES
jgi:hypothetical protein